MPQDATPPNYFLSKVATFLAGVLEKQAKSLKSYAQHSQEQCSNSHQPHTHKTQMGHQSTRTCTPRSDISRTDDCLQESAPPQTSFLLPESTQAGNASPAQVAQYALNASAWDNLPPVWLSVEDLAKGIIRPIHKYPYPNRRESNQTSEVIPAAIAGVTRKD